MNTHFLLLLLSILLTGYCFSQSDLKNEENLIETDTITVNSELPQYIVKVYDTDEDEWKSILKIYTAGDTTLFQTIKINCCLNTYNELSDINFDGYNDLEVSGFWHNWITGVSSFLLFNPELKTFEESEEFSDFGEISIDKANQTISSWAASAGHNKYYWSSTYKVVDHHLVLIGEEESHEYDSFRKELYGDSMVTVSESYVETKFDSVGKIIDNLLLHKLWIINTVEMIYEKLRPVKRVWQWIYEDSNPREIGKRLVQEMWPLDYEFVFEKEVTFEYSKDENNNLYVQETIGDIVDGKWVTETKPKTMLED